MEKSDIIDRLMDFENEGITASDRFRLRSEAADEILRLRCALSNIQKLMKQIELELNTMDDEIKILRSWLKI